MRHQTMNSINKFLRSNVAKTKKCSVGKLHSKMQTAGSTGHCRALETCYVFIVRLFHYFLSYSTVVII